MRDAHAGPEVTENAIVLGQMHSCFAYMNLGF
jgi:hypothetical protein